MTKRLDRTLIIAFTAAIIVSLFSTYSFAASSVALKNANAPSTISQGHGYYIKGTLTSNYRMWRVEVGVVGSNGKWTAQKYDKRGLSTKSFNLTKADSSIKFGKLSPGNYYYRIYAHTIDGKVHTVLNKKFTVKSNPGTIKTSGLTYPTSLVKGNGFALKGKIYTSKKMTSVTVGVTDASGRWTSINCTKKLSATSFNVASVDSKIKFGQLPAGNYKYKIVVNTTGGKANAILKPFRVINTAGVSTSTNVTTQPSASAPAVSVTADSSQSLAKSESDKVTLNGVNVPGTYRVGSNFVPKGTVIASEPIKRIEAGIVFAPTNKWLSHKYDSSSVNSNSFNLGSAASKLRFDQLPAGTYRYRIYVHTKSGIYLALNHKFSVTASGKPQAAVNWAIKVANDNSFTYGKKPQTSRLGCYYCGTTQKKKPKGYEKTYVCMTFVHAAYAHGAGDAAMLADDKAARYTLSLNDWNFQHYDCWEKIGLCKDLTVADLLPGDVICWWADDDASGHLSMYAGNGNIVDAAVEGWGADSIALRSGKAASYLKTGANFNKKSYVMRYRK